MTPNTALWIILTIAVLNIAVGAPLAWQFRHEMKRARARLDNYQAIGFATLLLGAATLALWWYYAVSIGEVLLGVIPTVTIVWGWLMRAVMNAHLGKP